MKKKLYIHVGPHKTGTTLIQKVCLDNQAELVKSGVLYPKRFLRIFGHHPLRDDMKDRKLDDANDFFISTDKDILISSEDFISGTIDDFKYLKEKFQNFDIHIIYSWRRASLKMYSIWQEMIKHGHSVSFFEFYHDHLAKPNQSYMLSADLQIERFSKIFGTENVHVIDYDQANSDGNLLSIFFKIIGCPYKEKYYLKSKSDISNNKSLDPIKTEMIRVLNATMNNKYHLTGNIVRETFLKNINNLDQKLISELTRNMTKHQQALNVGNYFIDKKTQRAIQNKFKKNIINNKDNEFSGTLTLVKDLWLMDMKNLQMLDTLSEQLYREIHAVN